MRDLLIGGAHGRIIVMRMGRRGVLAGAAVALVGCTPGPEQGAARTPTQPAPSMSNEPSSVAGGSTTTNSPIQSSPSPSPSSSATAPALPTRDEIVAQFTGQAPSQWGLEVDGVLLRTTAPGVCLTFDACGGRSGSGYDEDLISALVDTKTPATLFLNSRWIDANPQTVRDLMANPLFELANHGSTHRPLSVSGQTAYGISGTASVGEVHDEVAENQAVMTSLLGKPPRFFRSGTAHYDDVAVQIVRALGLVPVNFDINTDAGATFTARQVRAATLDARGGSICIGHFNRPGSGTAQGIAEALMQLTSQGMTFTTLDDALA